MNTEERLKTLEKEAMLIIEELKTILLDIRSFLMEAHSPLRAKADAAKLTNRDLLVKGVDQHGSK